MNKINIIDKLDIIMNRMSFCKENVYELGDTEYRGLRTAFEDEFIMAYNELNDLMDYLEKNDFEPIDTGLKEKFKSKKDSDKKKKK